MKRAPLGRYAALGLIVALCGCGGPAGDADAAGEAGPERMRLTAGDHVFGVVAPEGWSHRDHGDAQLFQRGRHVLAFEDLGVELDRHERPLPLAARIPAALSELDDAAHRDEASRVDRRIEGQRFVVVDTWDRLTHLSRRRFAFTLHEGSLLVLYTKYHLDRETYDAQLATFDGLLESLRFDSAGEFRQVGRGSTVQ